MRFFKVSLILTGSLIILSGIFYLGFLLYQQFSKPTDSPVNAISESTVMVIKVHKPGGLMNELRQSNIIWKEFMALQVFTNFRKETEFLDSAIHKEPRIQKVIQNYPLLIAVSMTGRSTFGLLFLTSVPGPDPEGMITEFLKNTYKSRVTILPGLYSTVPVQEVIVKGCADPFYFAVKNGVFMGSIHADLVKKAIDRLSLNIASITGTGFRKVEAVTGKKVDANIYINFRYLSGFLSRSMRDDYAQRLMRLSLFADWSGLDMIVKRNEFLINGYTTPGDSGTQFLPLLKEQAPQKIEITKVLPDNVRSFLFFGLSEPHTFYTKLSAYAPEQAEIHDYYQGFLENEEKSRVRYSDFILPWIGNEMAVVTTDSKFLDEGDNKFIIIRIGDRMLADSLLKLLVHTTGKKADTQPYDDLTIHHINIPDLIPATLGTFLGPFSGSFFTFNGNYIIFGTKPDDLKKLTDKITAGQVLDNNEEYKNYRENLADEANFYYYFDAKRSGKEIKSIFQENISSAMNPVFDVTARFDPVSIQLSNHSDMFYTSIFIRYNPELAGEGPLQWQTTLDTTAKGLPQVVYPKLNGEPSILVSDHGNNIYMLDNTGDIIWKTHLSGRIIGRINEIYRKNSDSAVYLFNTVDDICLINARGDFVKGFPVHLTIKATNPLHVISFPGPRDYHILIALADKKIHSFTIDGKSETGWKSQVFNEEITNPIQSISLNHKEYIFVTGRNGQVVITDRKGGKRIRLPKNLHVSNNATFYLNKTNKKGLFLTTDPTGKVIYIQENGLVLETLFNLFSPDHNFFYEDMNGDGNPEFIFFNRNSLYYYNRFFKLLYSYAFRHEITDPPFFCKSNDGERFIGFVSSGTNEVFLFGKNGLIQTDPGIHGNTPFALNHITSPQHLDMIIGSGKHIRNYKLPHD